MDQEKGRPKTIGHRLDRKLEKVRKNYRTVQQDSAKQLTKLQSQPHSKRQLVKKSRSQFRASKAKVKSLKKAYKNLQKQGKSLTPEGAKKLASLKKEMDKKNNDGLLEDMPEKRKKDGAFVRVGTTLYKLADMPLVGGGFVKKRIVWNNETLRQDYGRDYLATVPKYDGFCTVPDHVNYQPVVDKFLNLYEPIGPQPKEGEFSHSESLIHHIFGEQYELGIDYLQLLYLQPVQKLPILLMVQMNTR